MHAAELMVHEKEALDGARPRNIEPYVIQCAPRHALKSIARGMLAFVERVVVHRVAAELMVHEKEALDGACPQLLGRYVTQSAPHQALKLISWGMLTFVERVVVHRVVTR